MRALILSAGLGERLRPITLQRAKPAVEFLNVPMLGFPYYWLDTLGLSDVVFNTHYLPETVRHAAMHVVSPNTQLHFTHEEAILGSGGGIWNARFHLQWDDTFAVANGDGVVVFEEPDTIEQMLRHHRRSGALATMLVCPLEGVGTRIPGVWQDVYGEVVNFGKAPAKPGLECFHYASYMLISKRIWNYLPEGPSNILYDVFASAMQQGEKVFGFRVDQMSWFETGNIADYLTSTKTCLEYLRTPGRYGSSLKGLLDRHGGDYATHSHLEHLRLIDGTLDPNVHLSGFDVIGAKAEVGAGAQLHDCVVLPGARVEGRKTYSHQVFI